MGSKRLEPTERVGSVEDPQGPDRSLVDLARRRSARAHALPPAVGLQQLQERRVGDWRPSPGPASASSPAGRTYQAPLRDDPLDASELGPGPV